MGLERLKEMKSAQRVKATLISGFHNSSPILPTVFLLLPSFLPSFCNQLKNKSRNRFG